MIGGFMMNEIEEELSRMQEMIGEMPIPPVAHLIGYKVAKVEKGMATFTLKTRKEHNNPMGLVSGGIYCDLADAAMAVAYSTLIDNKPFVTVELKINYFKPTRRTELTAEANVIWQGANMGYIQCDIFDSNRNLVARASSTCKST